MNGGKYQDLARVARNWLVVLETSTPSERMFSICGLVDTSEGLILLGVSIEKQVFHYNNIKNFINFKYKVLVFTLIYKPLTNRWKYVTYLTMVHGKRGVNIQAVDTSARLTAWVTQNTLE